MCSRLWPRFTYISYSFCKKIVGCLIKPLDNFVQYMHLYFCRLVDIYKNVNKCKWWVGFYRKWDVLYFQLVDRFVVVIFDELN